MATVSHLIRDISGAGGSSSGSVIHDRDEVSLKSIKKKRT